MKEYKDYYMAPDDSIYKEAQRIINETVEKFDELKYGYDENLKPCITATKDVIFQVHQMKDRLSVLLYIMEKQGAMILELKDAVKHALVLMKCKNDIYPNYINSFKMNHIRDLELKYFYEAACIYSTKMINTQNTDPMYVYEDFGDETARQT